MGSLVAPDSFTHILRVLNTNVDGKEKIMYALTAIRGIGRRFSNICCKKAEVDLAKRAGELSAEELEAIMNIVSNPRAYKIPDWFLNRQKDVKDGRYSQLTSSQLDTKMRDDLERLKKIRNHRGLRHYWGLTVRGQHTKTTGRRGKTVGVAKKKQTKDTENPTHVTPPKKKRKMNPQEGSEKGHRMQKEAPMPAEPMTADAEQGYDAYVEGWKREDGLPEEVIRQVIASQHQHSSQAAVDAEIDWKLVGQGGPKVPLSELTDFMLERSRQ